MSSSPEMLPQLRTDIQLVRVQYQGRPVIIVKDSVGLSEGSAALNPQIAPLLALFDGSHTIRDLQIGMMRMGENRLVLEDEARQVIAEFDRLTLLRTARYEALLRRARTDFSALDRRPPALARTGYPADAEDLRTMIGRMLQDHADPDMACPAQIRAVVAPHIDLGIGPSIYGKTYALIQGLTPKRIIVLGTGHAMDELFSLTSKAYETPLGAFPVDVEAVDALRSVGSQTVSPDDFAHRGEHSVEFQILFLRLLLPPTIPLVPILCGSVTEWLPRVDQLSDIPEAASFLRVLRHLANENTLVVAGVDLSHVGPKFAHPAPASTMEDEFRHHDKALLHALCEGSSEAFWREARRVDDRFHVCGLSALAVLLEILPGARGRVVGYHVWHEETTRSAVSFAGAVLW